MPKHPGGVCDSVQTLPNQCVKLNAHPFEEVPMNLAIEPLLALVIGILILLVPRFLNYFVAVYLIVVGILGLVHR